MNLAFHSCERRQFDVIQNSNNPCVVWIVLNRINTLNVKQIGLPLELVARGYTNRCGLLFHKIPIVL